MTAPSSVAELVARAATESKSGDAQTAYRTLTTALSSGPDPLSTDSIARDALVLLASFARGFGAVDLASKLDACARQPSDANALYQAAYQLYEERQHAAAGALLFRANRVAPGQPAIVAELAGALEQQLRYGEAALVIDGSGIAERDPMLTYLSGFAWIMVGDLDRARQRLVRLANVPAGTLTEVRDALAGMVARADAIRGAGITLDDRALTAWHAALNGALLLHESPHGHPDPMRGRYAFVQDGPALVREGIERLHAVASARGPLPPRIVSAPDRASRIVATAIATRFGRPLAIWRAGDVAPGLVVAWSMDAVGDASFLQALHDHAPGRPLFAHASSWTDPFPYAPDVTTFLHQNVTNAWTGGALRVDPATRAVSRSAADARDDATLAREILEATVVDASVSSVDHVLAVMRALDAAPPAHRGGLSRTSGKRLRQRAGSAVPSNRFA